MVSRPNRSLRRCTGVERQYTKHLNISNVLSLIEEKPLNNCHSYFIQSKKIIS